MGTVTGPLWMVRAGVIKRAGRMDRWKAGGSGTVRFELTTLLKSTRFQDERHKPDSTKYPVILLLKCIYNKILFYINSK